MFDAGDLGAFVPAPPTRPREPLEDVAPETAPSGVLGGWLIAVKDNIDVAGWPTLAASQASPTEAAAEDAEVVRRLRRAGARPVCKTALDEFAFTTAGAGMSNPHDLARIVGGSSGGSALAVASGEYCVALGTDTGGSVRIPASYCGVVGFKPSFGLVPADGIVPLSWSLDHVGFLGCSVETIAPVFDACRDTRPAVRPARVDDSGSPRRWPRSWREVRVGVPPVEYLAGAVQPVLEALRRVQDLLVAKGARVGVVSPPPVEDVLPLHHRLVLAEAATYHAQVFGDYARHGRRAREAIESGLRLSAVDYVAAARGREAIRTRLTALFDEVDILLLPTAPTPAPLIGADSVELGDGRTVSQLEASIWYTSTFNGAGMPAISLPAPSTDLPIGVQLAAADGDDDLLLLVASAVEQVISGA